MKPESLIGITLELIQNVALPGGYPADARVGSFFRRRRYLGSRDRRFISEATYGWLRYQVRARARWRQWIEALDVSLPDESEVTALENRLARTWNVYKGHKKAKQATTENDPVRGPGSSNTDSGSLIDGKLRTIYLLDMLALSREGHFPWNFPETAKAVGLLPRGENEDPAWEVLAGHAGGGFLEGWQAPDDPVEAFSVEHSLPRWLASSFLQEQSAEHGRALARAMLEPATTDLRVNLRLREREKVRKGLEKEMNLEVELTHFSPLGLRLAARKNLTASTASRKGWIEVQDEGSQLAVLCTDPAAGMTVIDACAGNGGKALVFADILFHGGDDAIPSGPNGHIYACDIAFERLSELERRAVDSGLKKGITLVEILPAGPLPENLPLADLVLVDTPCSGLGTLRRNPQLKRRYGPQHVEDFSELQLSILERFATRVKSGGRLAYVSCSFLRKEGEDVASEFEKRHPSFRSYPSAWAAKRLPAGCLDGNRIRLDPVRTKTDAFFIATWEKAAV